MSSQASNPARVVPLRQASPGPAEREPLWRDVVGGVLRRERLAQERTLQDVADAARISMPYLSELERGRKEGSSEVLAAAAGALGLRLAELLALTQDELARRTGSTGRLQRIGASNPALQHQQQSQHQHQIRPQHRSGGPARYQGQVSLAA
ncbi:helix-turn-helix domain-containing protein [Streptomyces sp. NBC_00690]|uniref:helix-turn-helix domain-containing protein n=1 Tax=Streptomyces sp. NBC_00690 TaxID=2975808 RepID=UPI002E2E5819|nr:helix-turn-helix transcriptional regulator [Streptomyces sp. NBC_00690]